MTEEFSPRRPSLKVNALSNWAALGVNIVVGFLLTPFIISHLGKTGYGIWTLIGSFLGYYGLLNLGVDSALLRYVARYAEQGDKKGLNETISTAMAMFSCTGVFVIVASFAFATPLATFFEVAPEHLDNFKHLIWILGISTGLSFPGNVFGTVLTARERYVAFNIVAIGTTVIRACLTVLMLVRGHGLLGVAYATLIVAILRIVINYLLCGYLALWSRINFASAKWRVLSTLLVYGATTSVIIIADLLRFNLDSFVIGKWVGMSEVGIYGIAALLIRYMLRLVAVGMGVLKPRFAALDSIEERAKLKRLFLRSLSVSSLLGFGTSMLAIIFGGHFIILWVGEEFAAAIPVLWILAISYAFALSQGPGISLMYALNKHYYFAVASMIEAVANVVISILLAQKYGIIGVALGTAIPMLIIKIVLQPIYVSRIMRISYFEYVRPSLVPLIAFLSITILCYRSGIMTNWQDYDIYELAVWGIVVGLIYATIVILVSRDIVLTDIIRNLIKAKDRVKTKWE